MAHSLHDHRCSKKKKILNYYMQGLKKQDVRFRINLKIIQDYFS